jgi:perosamine synthetase
MNPVLYCGAKPVLLDVDPETWCLDLALLRGVCQRSIGRNRIKAVVPVHLYGCACDMTELLALAKEFDFLVVEDATEALGTTLNGRQVGTFGQVGCFSFNGNKLLTTGSGGMVVTDSEELAIRIRYLVNQARDNSDAYIHGQMGFNYRMDSLSAALGIAQLGQCDTFLARKHAIAKAYNTLFAGVPGIQVPPVGAGVEHCYWLYSAVLADPVKRDLWIRSLNAAGIAARPFFHPLHAQPYMNVPFWVKTATGIVRRRQGTSDRLSCGGINLPSSSGMTDGELAIVTAELGKLIG